MSEYINERNLEDDLADILLGEKIPLDIYDAETGVMIIPANEKITRSLIRKMANRKEWVELDPHPIRNKILETINTHLEIQ
jgi:DNA-directed RNA polymerase subunit beta